MTLLHVHEFAEKRRIYMYALTIFFFFFGPCLKLLIVIVAFFWGNLLHM